MRDLLLPQHHNTRRLHPLHTDGTFDPAQPEGDNVWDESVRRLKAAKKQLTGF
jgi:hypothetical protein